MSMCFEFAFDTGFSESYTEPWLSPTIGKHGVPSRRSIKRLDLHLKQLFHSITKCVVFCFRRLKGDALLCPRKLIYTCISYTTTPLNTDLLSVALRLHPHRLPKKYLHKSLSEKKYRNQKYQLCTKEHLTSLSSERLLVQNSILQQAELRWKGQDM